MDITIDHFYIYCCNRTATKSLHYRDWISCSQRPILVLSTEIFDKIEANTISSSLLRISLWI